MKRKPATLYLLNKVEKMNYNTKNLGDILRRMYFEGLESKSALGHILLFGVKYGRIMDSLEISSNDVVSVAGINESYAREVDKARKLASLIHDKTEGTAFVEL